MSEARYQREMEFHDKIFAADTRKSAARFYSITHGSSKAFYRNYLATHCAGKRVLEYGCGPNSHALFIASKQGSVTGIDLSPVAIVMNRAAVRQKGLSKASFLVMNAELLAFTDSSFDLICGNGILHHLDLERCFAELSRTLKPEGTAVFLEPLGHNPLINLYRKLTRRLRSADEHPLLETDFGRASSHFGRLDVTYFHLTSLLAVLFSGATWFPRLVQQLDKLDQALFRRLPWLRKHAWAVAIVLSGPKKSVAGLHESPCSDGSGGPFRPMSRPEPV